MKHCLHLAVLLLAGVGVIQADVVHLSSGRRVQGQVVSYWRMAFEVRSADGGITKLPQPAVKRIEFESRTAVIQSRNRGTVRGQLKTFENSAFTVLDEQGQTTTVPATFIKEVTFGGGGSGQGVDTISNGARVDLKDHLVQGRVTIVDFYADWCGPCRAISPTLERLAKDDADVFLRKVNIVQWGSPVARQYQITSIPHIRVYDRQGRLAGTVSGAGKEQVARLVETAKQSR